MIRIYARCPEALGMWRITRSGTYLLYLLTTYYLQYSSYESSLYTEWIKKGLRLSPTLPDCERHADERYHIKAVAMSTFSICTAG